MFSNPYFAKCFDAPKTEEQKDHEVRVSNQLKEEVLTLPLQQGFQHCPFRLYKGFWFPEIFIQGVLSLPLHLHPNPSDIFLMASFPKSGTTWLKALAFLISTHIPCSVLPESIRDSPCRIIYLCREPKDTIVSTYHFFRGMISPEAALQPFPFMEAVELFCKGLSGFGPLWEHQLEYWRESQRRPNKVLFLKYEDLKTDPEEGVRRMAEFMGMRFTAEEEMSGMVGEIVRQTSFERLSGLEVNKVGFWTETKDFTIKNSSFFRNGRVGDWREHFTADMAERIDSITWDKMHQSGLIH